MAYSKNPNTAVGEPQQVETNQVGVKLNPTTTVCYTSSFFVVQLEPV